MKRFLILLVTCLLLFSTACADSVVDPFWDAGTAFLFETSRAGMHASADFALDGETFKNLGVDYVQQDMRSYLDVTLWTPRLNREDLISGYTVFADDGCARIIEKLYPDYYTERYVSAEDRILRSSVETERLMALGREVLTALSQDVPMTVEDTEDGGKKLSFTIGEGKLPAYANAALNLAYSWGVRHFFHLDYDTFTPLGYAEIGNYMTITDGILYCYRSLSLMSADVSVTLDSQGRVAYVRIIADLALSTRNGDSHVLSVGADLSVTDYETAEAPLFDPDTYGVFAISEIR